MNKFERESRLGEKNTSCTKITWRHLTLFVTLRAEEMKLAVSMIKTNRGQGVMPSCFCKIGEEKSGRPRGQQDFLLLGPTHLPSFDPFL